MYYSYYCWRWYYRSVVFSEHSGFLHHHHRHDIAEILLKVTLNTITLTLTLESKIVLFRANIKRRRIFSCTRHVSGMTFIIIRYSRPTVLLIWFPLVIQSMFQVYDRNTITWLSQSNKLWWLLNKRSEGVNS